MSEENFVNFSIHINNRETINFRFSFIKIAIMLPIVLWLFSILSQLINYVMLCYIVAISVYFLFFHINNDSFFVNKINNFFSRN